MHTYAHFIGHIVIEHLFLGTVQITTENINLFHCHYRLFDYINKTRQWKIVLGSSYPRKSKILNRVDIYIKLFLVIVWI